MLIMSDGSSTIYFLSPTFELITQIYVSDGKLPVSGINEMELINGEVSSSCGITRTSKTCLNIIMLLLPCSYMPTYTVQNAYQ